MSVHRSMHYYATPALVYDPFRGLGPTCISWAEPDVAPALRRECARCARRLRAESKSLRLSGAGARAVKPAGAGGRPAGRRRRPGRPAGGPAVVSWQKGVPATGGRNSPDSPEGDVSASPESSDHVGTTAVVPMHRGVTSRIRGH